MATEIAVFDGKHQFVICCDFCAKPNDEVLVLIASPNGAHICDDCVDVCGEVVAEKRASQPGAPS